MDSIVETVKLRISKFGLSQSVVRPVGSSEVLVEIPRASPDAIDSVRNVLKQQGRFEALIDGEVAVSGSDVISGAVGGSNNENVKTTTSGKVWELGFTVTREGGERFAKAALGKGDYPVYMFLDRPQNAMIIARKLTIHNTSSLFSEDVQPALDSALAKGGDRISLVYAEDAQNLSIGTGILGIIVEEGVEEDYPAIAAAIASRNVTTKRLSTGQLKPSYESVKGSTGVSFLEVSRWDAIGLICSPILSPSLADGRINQVFQVSGPAKGVTAEEQQKSALAQLRELKSVISGGKLPVSTTIGSSFSVAPSLGERFLQYSWLVLVVGVFAVSVLIFLRYRQPALVVPIVVFNGIEVLLTTAIIGCVLGTLDLSAMAGIIVLMGSGVADQIVITEEMLRRGHAEEEGAGSRDEYEVKERIKKAFYVVFTVAGVVIAAMLPLIVLGTVEIIGFGMSTVIGVLVGVFITRPAYGDIMRELFQKRG
jgi:preprotein translocase subunit SecD